LCKYAATNPAAVWAFKDVISARASGNFRVRVGMISHSREVRSKADV
jgi:hypothetical protein